MKPTQSLNYFKYLLFLPLLTPFFVGLNTTTFPFIVLKAVYFSVVLGVLILLAVNILFKQKTVFWSKSNLLGAVGLVFLVNFLSVIFSINFQNSFWGSFERMEGFVFFLPFFFYFLFLVLFLKQEKDWRLFLKASLVMGWGVILLGVIQYFSPADKPFLALGGSNRVFSTLGNYIYLGHFSLYVFWLSVLIFWQEKKWRWVWALSAFLGFVGIYLAQSRGPFLGWVLSLFLFGLIYLFLTKNIKMRLGVGIVLGVIAVFLVSSIFFQPKIFQKVLVVSGLQDIKTLGGSADTRLMAWNIAWQAFTERPVLGWGNFSYQYAFNKFYNPGFLAHGWGETWFDHSHNQFLDTLANQGALGFLAFLSLFVFGSWLLIKKMWREKDSQLVSLSALALLASLFINYLFAFDNISTSLFFFIFLAWIVGWTSGGVKEVVSKWPVKLGLVVVAGVGVLILYSGFSLFGAAKKDRQALLAFETDPMGTLVLMKTSVAEAGPMAFELRNDFALAINGINRPASGTTEAGLFIEMTKEGIDMLKENIKTNPYDVRRQLVLEQMYKDLTVLGVDSTKEATDLLEQAKILSPKRQQIYYYLAEIKLFQGDSEGAIAEVQKTLDKTPGVYQGYWFLAKLEGSRNNWVKAKEYLDLAKAYSFIPTTNTEKSLVQVIEDEVGKK